MTTRQRVAFIRDLTIRQRRRQRQREKSRSSRATSCWRSCQNWGCEFYERERWRRPLMSTKVFSKLCLSFVTPFSWLMLPVWLSLKNLCYSTIYTKNADLPYTNYERFDLDKMTDDECKTEFRFYKNDIYNLADVLTLPDRIVCYNGVNVDMVEALCIFLKRASEVQSQTLRNKAK